MSLESRTRRLLRASSRKWNIVLGALIAALFCASLAVRFYAIEPVRIVESALEPELPAGKTVWLCKLPVCTEHLRRGDVVLARFPGKGPALRTVFGLPGDSVHVHPDGKIFADGAHFTWEDESEILAPRTFYVPRKDDTVSVKDLNDISFDYAVSYLHRNFGHRSYFVRTKLYRGLDTLPISRVGSAHLFGRPIGTREIHGMHWQEHFLISLQINREEPGARRVHFERSLYKTSDSTEVVGFRFTEDAYYLICLKGNRCEDSRNGGYVPKSQITGKVLRFRIPFAR